ncbi:DNAJ JJJ1-like protein [Cardamine amara subsp. amara]|uniref:DNAJ JJJ1-like protein n=1 Tax=Cardamine amara subsp. amara TaxID=228776 RepID=A0ABD0ZQR8_CARAN
MQSWGINSAIKLLTYSTELSDGKPLYASSNCLPVKALNREPAGHAFHSAALKLRGCAKEATDKNEDTKKKASKEKDNEYVPSYDSHNNKGKKKSGKQQHDHYALLGLGNLRYLATEDQIRKSYRDTALKHHPDKLATLLLAEETEEAKQAKKDEIESHFKLIQEAYEVLMDPTKRRIYDSTDEFDDEVPADCAPKDFFKVFGPAFKRNARWSVNSRVPDLGDENTPLKEVDSFYNYWYTFKSWREFPEEEEHDLEEAESREEKRWMERENARKTQKARKEEYARIRTLVDNAYKKDTRILKRKEDEKAKKLQKKEAKVMAKKKLEEEAAAAIEEEKRRKEEEAKRAAEAAQQQKRAKEKEKKLMRKERSRLRTLSAPVLSQRLLGISVEYVEDLCMSLDTEQLRKLCDKMENKEGMALAKVLKNGNSSNDDDETETKEEEIPVAVKQNGHVVVANGHVEASVETATHQKKEKPWSKEEIDMLRKGTTKFPKGTSQRWEVISEYIGTGRSVEEILKATKTVLLQKPDSAKAFDSFLEKRKPAASIASPLSTREELGEPIIPTKPHEDNNATKTETTEQNGKSEENNKIDNSEPDAVTGSDPDGWSAVQERALVQAMKTFPKETNQRWERVAAAVPGKTMNQCKKKFTGLKDIIRSKKPTA